MSCPKDPFDKEKKCIQQDNPIQGTLEDKIG